MSDVSKGEGWWQAPDGRWYPPPPHLRTGEAPTPSPVESPTTEIATGSDPIQESPEEPVLAAPSTIGHCGNGHEMPDSAAFCSTCGSRRADATGAPPGKSDPASEVLVTEADPEEWVRTHLKAVFIVAVAVVLVLVGIFGIVATTSGSSSPSTPSHSSSLSELPADARPWSGFVNGSNASVQAAVNDLHNYGGDFTNISDANLASDVNAICEDLMDGRSGASTANDVSTGIAEYPDANGTVLTQADGSVEIAAAVIDSCPGWLTVEESYQGNPTWGDHGFKAQEGSAGG